MREIVILSGKGGTGKTSLTAAFAHLAKNHMICDLDVDAPDLHLVLEPRIHTVTRFISGHQAVIRPTDCDRCGQCVAACHFQAIRDEEPPRIDSLKCEGCKLCVAVCPAGAIDFVPNHCGDWYRSTSRFGHMLHAQLLPGEENSGRLVALLRRQARAFAEAKGLDLILSDGPPGIGCPVISSLSGANLAIIVTEPTVSGRHDLERVLGLCRHFSIPAGVIINKCDLNPDQTEAIAAHCRGHRLNLIGRLPHHPVVTEAMLHKSTVTEYTPNGMGAAVKDIWEKVLELLAAEHPLDQAV